MKKTIRIFLVLLLVNTSLFALPFNNKLTESELNELNSGNVLIRNINNEKNISLSSENELAVKLISEIKDLSPRYLAEVIKIKPYKGNENLPEKLNQLLLNVPEYAGIPYWSERHQRYYDLYSSAEITSFTENGDITNITADIEMDPFGLINQKIDIYNYDDCILYYSENLNNMKFEEKITCVSPHNMKMCILLIKDGENWILYGIGGVKAPKIPFLTERIQTSFINRIKTFCNFVFTKLD